MLARRRLSSSSMKLLVVDAALDHDAKGPGVDGCARSSFASSRCQHEDDRREARARLVSSRSRISLAVVGSGRQQHRIVALRQELRAAAARAAAADGR